MSADRGRVGGCMSSGLKISKQAGSSHFEFSLSLSSIVLVVFLSVQQYSNQLYGPNGFLPSSTECFNQETSICNRQSRRPKQKHQGNPENEALKELNNPQNAGGTKSTSGSGGNPDEVEEGKKVVQKNGGF